MTTLLGIILSLLSLIMEMSSYTVDLKASESVYTCSPVVKGIEYIFSGTIKHTISEKMDLLWVKNKVPVSMCKSNMACYEYSDASTLTTIEQVAGDIFQYSLTIKNVTDLDEGVWSLKYLGLASLRISEPLFSCNLNVYDVSALTLYDCPEVVEEEKSVSCWCITNNSTEGGVDLAWFDAKGHKRITKDNLISFIATRKDTDHQCRGITSSGEKVMPLIYKPLIVAKAEIIECRTDYNKSDWKIICTIDRIYPQAECHFDIKVYDKNLQLEMDLEPELKSIEYFHEYLDNDRLYFKSVCALTLPALSFLSNYTIVVNVNPNVTGSDSDLMYAVKKTVSGYYVLPKEGDETKGANLTTKVMFIIVCVALIHFLLLIVLFGIFRITRKCCISENLDKYTRLEYTETYLTTKENLSDTTLFHVENLEQESKDLDDTLESLGIVLKHGKCSEEKYLLPTHDIHFE